MTDYATLPLQAHEDRSAFLEHAWNIGRAYRNQAIELIATCHHLSQDLSRLAAPKFFHEDAELRRLRRVCDLALHSAAASSTKVTDEANARFKEAAETLRNHLERWHHLGLHVCSNTEMARLKAGLSHAKFDEYAEAMTIKFVLLRSPLLSPHDPQIIVSQEFSGSPTLPEILWNFSRYKDDARITLEQNPHFYLRCPADESAYTPTFRRHPLWDTSGVLEHDDTVYVLVDRPSRVFLHTEHKSRIFGNIWMLNGSLIFKDIFGVLEGEQYVRGSNTQYHLRHCEQVVASHDSDHRFRFRHNYLWPIVTSPANYLSDEAFEDWTALTHPAQHSIDLHIYGLRGCPVSPGSLDLPPPPPTSIRPEYQVLYMASAINMLKDDILVIIFNYYRLANMIDWNVRLGWCKLSHVCRRWRQLIFETAFHLGMYILCTYGTPRVDTLDHLPPLQLFVDYQDGRPPAIGWRPRWVTREDELGIHYALQLPNRVRRINLCLSSSTLDKALLLMDKPFPLLEHLSLSVTGAEINSPTLPKTFLGPNIRHLSILGIRLPKRLRLLSSTLSLITLRLTKIPASGYFQPRLLIARLELLPQLEELSIGFSIPIPRPSTERLLLGKQGAPVMLSNLKSFTFRGVSAYLEHLVSQMRIPVVEKIDITLFNQIAFILPHLSHLVDMREQIKPNTAKIISEHNKIAVIMTNSTGLDDNSDDSGAGKPFVLHVMCRPIDWQIDCAAQICSALMPMMAGVENLTLSHKFNRPSDLLPSQIRPVHYDVDSTTWHELLTSFIGVKKLLIDHTFSEELSHALEVDEIGLNPGLLPDLQELVIAYDGIHRDSVTLFGSFIHARQAAGRPVSFKLLPSLYGSLTRPDVTYYMRLILGRGSLCAVGG